MENVGKYSAEENTSNIFVAPTRSYRNRRTARKKKNKLKQRNKSRVSKSIYHKKDSDTTMSSWSEAYMKAATWQYKHQIAYWKAKAKALEVENRILHDIIRKKHGGNSSTEMNTSATVSEVESDIDDIELENCNVEERQDDGDPDLEVSEAYIEFLRSNAIFKEDARRERERLKAAQASETEEDRVARMEAPPEKSPEDHTQELKDLYGSDWQRMQALEMSLTSQFTSDCDVYKPIYWPNIPFNFNYSWS